MKSLKTELIPTRASLLQRLKSVDAQTSWNEFVNIYHDLIRGVARQAGLSDAEADDVVQETLISAAKRLPRFDYDPAGSFKAWLLRMTRWQISRQFRIRRRHSAQSFPEETETCTNPIEKIPDPLSQNLDAIWDADWNTKLLEAAMARLKRKADPEKFQIFDLYVRKEWDPARVAAKFNLSVNQVYLIKHRFTALLKSEVELIEKELIDVSGRLCSFTAAS
jgi:RNA polymerase sigma factor (sigma-70 family)